MPGDSRSSVRQEVATPTPGIGGTRVFAALSGRDAGRRPALGGVVRFDAEEGRVSGLTALPDRGAGLKTDAPTPDDDFVQVDPGGFALVARAVWPGGPGGGNLAESGDADAYEARLAALERQCDPLAAALGRLASYLVWVVDPLSHRFGPGLPVEARRDLHSPGEIHPGARVLVRNQGFRS